MSITHAACRCCCLPQIAKYKAIAAEIASFKDTMTIGYVKVNAKPLRQALSTWASKWVYLFTHYLQVWHYGLLESVDMNLDRVGL